MIGFAAFLVLLGPAFILNHSPFLATPLGDIAAERASYFLIASDRWRFPLLALPYVNSPEGTNAFFLGGIPFVALVARIIRDITGHLPDLTGAWYLACYTLQAHAFFFLLRQMTDKRPILLALASIVAVLAYSFLTRFGHISLCGQFIVIYAMALALSQNGDWRRPVLLMALLNVFALYIFAYFAVSTSILLAAALLNLLARRRITPVQFLSAGSASLALLVLCAWAGGLFGVVQGSTLIGASSYATLGLNIGSLFIPPQSALFPAQPLLTEWWEGTFYLGAAVSALLLLNLIVNPNRILAAIRANWAMVAVLALFSIYAVSNRVSFGATILFEYPLPRLLNPIVGFARAGGRLFWPIGYLLMAAAIVLTVQNFRRLAIPLVALAICGAVAESTGSIAFVKATETAIPTVPVPWSVLQTAANSHKRFDVYPSFWCYPGDGAARILQAQLSIENAKATVASNNAITVRKMKDCGREAASLRSFELEAGAVIAFMTEPAARGAFIGKEAAFVEHCRQFAIDASRGFLCALDWSNSSPPMPLTHDLAFGDTIDFTMTGNWERYAANGWWSRSDGPHTWTEGLVSSLQFRLPESGHAFLELEIYSLLVLPALPARTTQVFINGELVDTWRFTESVWHKRTVTIPNSVDRSRPVELRFVQNVAPMQKEIRASEEDRRSALALKSIRLLSGP